LKSGKKRFWTSIGNEKKGTLSNEVTDRADVKTLMWIIKMA
jgi:hypothetical protein